MGRRRRLHHRRLAADRALWPCSGRWSRSCAPGGSRPGCWPRWWRWRSTWSGRCSPRFGDRLRLSRPRRGALPLPGGGDRPSRVGRARRVATGWPGRGGREAKARAGSRFGGLAGPLLAALGAAVLVISLVSNVPHLVEAGGDYRRASALAAGQFGAFDLTREGRTARAAGRRARRERRGQPRLARADARFSNPDGVDKVVRAAPAYYTIRDRFGLPADDPATVRERSPSRSTGRVVVASYPLRLVPGERASDVCRGRPPADEGAAPLAIANGELLIDAARGGATDRVRGPVLGHGRAAGRLAGERSLSPARAPPRRSPPRKPWLVSVQGARPRPHLRRTRRLNAGGAQGLAGTCGSPSP